MAKDETAVNPGAALARLRWDKATRAQKSAAARHMSKARWGSQKGKGKA